MLTPDPISNSKLFELNNINNRYRLKNNLEKNKDYIIINQFSWFFFVSNYGSNMELVLKDKEDLYKDIQKINILCAETTSERNFIIKEEDQENGIKSENLETVGNKDELKYPDYGDSIDNLSPITKCKKSHNILKIFLNFEKTDEETVSWPFCIWGTLDEENCNEGKKSSSSKAILESKEHGNR